jgi:formate/nitrite transporter FocA (FNT family)
MDRPNLERRTGTAQDGPGTEQTERSRERAQEDELFVPVIVKRTDEARRHPDDILQAAIDEGQEQLERPLLSLGLSAVAAGLILGFTAMAVAVAYAATASITQSVTLIRAATALVYPLGFVVCMMAGTELFTEHTATAVYPVLDRRSGVGRLVRLWAVVLFGNLLGAGASAGLLALAGDVVGAREGYLAVGRHLVGFETLPLLASGLLAGWLMALAAWLILSTPPAVSQIASIYVVTFLIGFGGLHHSIAGAVEVFTALLMGGGAITTGQAARCIVLAVVGNLLGGSLFVAVLNYGHIKKSRMIGK